MDSKQGNETHPDIANIKLPFSTDSSSSITMSVSDIEGGFIAVSYTAPNGNDSVANSNNLYVWQGTNDVPWNLQPIATATAAPGGNAIPGNFSAQDYVVGYSVGPSVTVKDVATYPNVCATAGLPADWNINAIVYVTPSLAVSSVQTNIITFIYQFANDFNPAGNNAWVGFYNGSVIPYGSAPVQTAAISLSTSSGSVAMPGVDIAPHGTYTVALFTSGYSTDPTKLNLTTIAATAVFTTSAMLD